MIIIPMAGLSSRFFKAGFTEPKYKLQAHGKSLFEWSIRSFEKYFSEEKFIFICRDVYETPRFVDQELKKIGVNNYQIITLAKETKGQAETVYLSLKDVPDDESLLIFNIDTCRMGCEYPNGEYDAWLEVFEGEGDHWSFARVDSDTDLVVETAEKVRISGYCSNGVYYFKDKKIYIKAYHEMVEAQQGEQYIAPMFNYVINDSGVVGYKKVALESHIFMGTPAEYNEFMDRNDV